MGWEGKFFGALIGLLVTRSVWGAVIGAFIGQVFDQERRAAARPQPSLPAVFFRTMFEVMGHVAKSDGRVSEAEIEAARRTMRELGLGPDQVSAAIASFGVGKAPGYDVDAAVARFRAACGPRRDLLAAFMELQLRAALAGNDLSPPARAILTRVAEQIGISGLEFVRMEASLRGRSGGGARPPGAKPSRSLATCYAELGIDASASDREVTKAYRRQMSRHHPDKLVARGLPESMAQAAKEKTQRIQEAYEQIRAARGMR
ncbi:MAG: co-chaperone DjlA [Gammaproteobacteria bacterium]|nr:co-chaperone DjlA [Gammaproteobacteria bacterium]